MGLLDKGLEIMTLALVTPGLSRADSHITWPLSMNQWSFNFGSDGINNLLLLFYNQTEITFIYILIFICLLVSYHTLYNSIIHTEILKI